jgi:rod shape-determining protein MreC
MNKSLFYILSITFILYYSYINKNSIKDPVLYFTDKIKFFISDVVEPVERFYLNITSREIENLRLENEKLAIIATSAISDLREIQESLKVTKIDINLKAVNVISRSNFNDHYSLWIDFKDFNTSKIYGLIHNTFSAGIVVNSDGRPKALLNHNNKCSYSVQIGKNSIPGILNGSKSSKLVIDYIPQWLNINIGDEVTTSGLDNIFPKGIKVGKIVQINTLSGYKQAFVEPYNDTVNSKYYYLIDIDTKSK